MAESKIYIIGMTDCKEAVCAASGRISTQNGTALEIFDSSRDEEKNSRLISKVAASGHTSTLEHLFFNLAFENVSVVVEQFMIEFRLASFTVKSRRYVDFSNCGFYTPNFENEDLQREYNDKMKKLFELYALLCEKGVPKEDARFVLPYCFFSNFYCSMNARELINVLSAMLCGRGRDIPEIYALGQKLLEDCKEKAPGVFGSFEKLSKDYSDTIDLSFIEREEEKETKHDGIEILSYTENCERLIAETALIGEGGFSSREAEKAVQDEEVLDRILSSVVKSSRARALESADFTIKFNDISLSTLTHLARHRIQSLSVPSLLKCKRESYIIPDSLKGDEELLSKYIEAFESNEALYKKLRENKVSEGECVYCLLSGNTLSTVSTMNARQLLLFLRLRTCERAQWEIRDRAIELLQKLRKISPKLFSFYGPSCFVKGYCPEGRLSCGKATKMKEKFSTH